MTDPGGAKMEYNHGMWITENLLCLKARKSESNELDAIK